jgi:hypothetical protein
VLRRAAHSLEVPGAPLTLQLDTVDVQGDKFSIVWSFVDPEVLPDPSSQGGRIRGTLVVRARSGASAEEQASAWWAQAQLQAAQRFKSAVDADWIPGEPVRRREWSVAGAWQALLDHLSTDDAGVQVVEGQIRVTHQEWRSVYRIDPNEWAAYLNRVEAADHHEDDYIVPAAMPLVHGLPLWAVDELAETEGAHGPVVALVDGRLVGLGTGSLPVPG